MKKIDFKILITTVIVCLLPCILGVILYNKLPNTMAVHWGINNIPNNFVSKNFAIFGLPAVMALFQIIICTILDLQEENKEANKKIALVSKWLFPIISIVVMTIIILYSLNTNIDIRQIVCILVGLILIILGNYLPKTKSNSTMGIRNKWTMNDENVWNKVTRVMGYVMMIFGFLFIISLLMKEIYSIILLVVFIVVMLLVTPIYSYYLSNKSK